MRYEAEVRYESGKWPRKWMTEGTYETMAEAVADFQRIKSELKLEHQKFTIQLLKWEAKILKAESHDHSK
jgi:hypothetical protein